MVSSEIIKFCIDEGVLVDKDILYLFNEVCDFDSVKLIIEKIKQYTPTKFITKDTFEMNQEKFDKVFLDLPEENKKSFEKLKIKLGLNIEISKEISIERNIMKDDSEVKIISTSPNFVKSYEVKDFINYFRERFNEMRVVLQGHSELDKLISINKLSSNHQSFSLIGLVYDKRITKNKNIILDIEDLTGKIKVLVNQNKPELYAQAEEITPDSVIGFRGSGNKDILFANEIIFPDSSLTERKKSPVEEYALFIGDIHYGSKRFLRDNFLKFIDYLNGNLPDTPEADKIKYLFIAGDIVTGIGNYPNQEPDLEVVDLEEQFIGIAELLKQIRKDIKIIISPGNHDCVRLMEPQPIFDEKFAWSLYELENVIIIKNPSTVNIASRDNLKH